MLLPVWGFDSKILTKNEDAKVPGGQRGFCLLSGGVDLSGRACGQPRQRRAGLL